VTREPILEETERRWGQADFCDELLRDDAPSMAADERFRRWYATRLRLGSSPGAARALMEPTLMLLGRAAGLAAARPRRRRRRAQAARRGVAVRDVDVDALQRSLLDRGQVLSL
jgi:hypothetical protein